MAVGRDETLPIRTSRRRRAGPAGRPRSGRSSSASAWWTRPRSSPRPASWPATPSIYGGGGTRAPRGAARRRAPRAAPDLRGPGPGHRRHRAGAEGRLHDRRRASASGSAARKRLSNEFDIDSAPGAGHARHASRDGSDAMHGRSLADRRRQPGRRGAARAPRRWPQRLGLRRDRRGQRGARRHRAGDEPRQARAAAASCSCARSARRTRGVGAARPRPRARAWPTSRAVAARRLLDRRHARAPAWARSGGSPTSFDIYSRARRRARRSWPRSGPARRRRRAPALESARRQRAHARARTCAATPGRAERRAERHASCWSPTGSVTAARGGRAARAAVERLPRSALGARPRRLVERIHEAPAPHARRRGGGRRARPRGAASSASRASATSRAPILADGGTPAAWSRTTAPPGTTSRKIQEFTLPVAGGRAARAALRRPRHAAGISTAIPGSPRGTRR